MYPGITYLGTGRFVGLYGLNETIIDQKATGLQHLFIDDYSIDLIHTACSVCTIDGKAYYGDRIKPKSGHSLRQTSFLSRVLEHCVFEDRFDYGTFSKTDRITAYDENYIYFESEIHNLSDCSFNAKLSALCITQNNTATSVEKYGDSFIILCEGKVFGIKAQSADVFHASLDAPSGFMYRGIEDIQFDQNRYTKPILSDISIACSVSRNTEIQGGQTVIFRWMIVVGDDLSDCRNKLDELTFDEKLKRSISYWQAWLSINAINSVSNYPEASNTALIALKAANLSGFLPADLTGHYFAKNKVCFYVRDALMGARAFLYSGHIEEFESVISFLLGCPLKNNGEFYQRYNAQQLPDEGANNNVFSQMDAIGYFTRDVSDYVRLCGKLPVDMKVVIRIVDVLFALSRKNGLFGPEGGVNEGVYGPAYITSTNMFIAGGLLGIAKVAENYHEWEAAGRWSKLALDLIAHIEMMFIDESYYSYGYVDYHDDKIRRYDTPQFLGASIGYPITANYRKNFEYLLKSGTYFGLGFGYSEQEYHNGPWLFNTAAAAQTAYILDNKADYLDIMKWILEHRNYYGLLPEAVDARDEKHSFINPLMWANAEMVVACYVGTVANLRGEHDD